MTYDPASATPQRPRWLYPVLIASLGVNLLLLGGAASAFWNHRHDRRDHSLVGFVRTLPADRQGPLREFLDAERVKLKPIRDEMGNGWNQTNKLLGEEPFDKEKFKQAMARMNDVEDRMRASIAEGLVETAARMTPQERILLKEWRERQIARGVKKWRRHFGDDEARK